MYQIAETAFKIILSVLLSSVMGIEREMRQKGAGLRTHILVGVGSTLIVLTSLHLFNIYKVETVMDPTRMIAGLITGIGFLCAGTIIRAGSDVRGLTSAATLWIVSCVGIAVGAGDYIGAIIVTSVVFFVLIWVKAFEKKIGNKFKSDQ